jgi:hypothetical protein
MIAINRSLLWLVALLVLLAAASPAWADSACNVTGNLIVNCGFETGDFTGWTTPSPLPNYYLIAPADTPNGTQPNGSGNGYYVYDGTYAAQLGSDPATTLSQTFTDVAGESYDLTFYLNGDSYPGSTNFFDATVAGATLDLTDVTSYWTQYSLVFTGTGSDTLTFTFDDNGGNFLSLDDVGVPGPTSATSEPSSLLLLGTGIAGVAGLMFRRYSS